MEGSNFIIQKWQYAQLMIDHKNAVNNMLVPGERQHTFRIHANTIVDFNKWLITGAGADRDSLGILVTELLYELLEQWSGNNQTLHQWTHAEWKDFGNIIFIHAYNEPVEVMLHIGMNGEGIYLQMNTRFQEAFVNGLPDSLKKHLLQLSSLGKFESCEENDYFLILWPYENYSIIDIFSNGSIAFSLMYHLCLELNQPDNLLYDQKI
jgi:hypothetical protein